MIRRTVRNVTRVKLSRSKTIALLIFLLAAVFEVYTHTSRYSVRAPEQDLDAPFYTTCQEPPSPNDTSRPRANAALVMLVRNKELDGALKTIASVERKFNRWFHYPIVFLNNEPWTEEFMAVMTAAVSGEARFEVIPTDEWTFPAWMDADDARASIKSQGQWMIKFAGLETYHHMCRFYSGKFYTLEALQEYKWYWRIEPDVEFYCDITYDPFVEMEKRGKVYGFTIAVPEGPRTCPSLFRQMSDWKEAHHIEDTEMWKTMVSPSWVPWPFRNLLAWVWHRDRNGDPWSLCHYWSNFEIANLEFFRGKAYQSLFEYLDSTGGFYYERVRLTSYGCQFWDEKLTN
jgi:mannosyltransferase